MQPLSPASFRTTAAWDAAGAWRRIMLLALILGAPVLRGEVPGLPLAVTSPTIVPEYNLKAGYLLLFTRYVTWPAGAFPAPESPVVIGVLGANPFGDVLARTVKGLQSQGRPIEVRTVKTVDEAARCHVVFIARGQERDEAGWLGALRGRPVLTVSESARGLERGAVIFLALEESRRGTKVAFTASLPATQAAGLHISASMLASARTVIRETGSGGKSR